MKSEYIITSSPPPVVNGDNEPLRRGNTSQAQAFASMPENEFVNKKVKRRYLVVSRYLF